MIRAMRLRDALLIVLPLAGLVLADAARAEVRRAVSVDRETIRVGDLFPAAGAQAGAMVMPTPRPGTREVFDAERLRAVAQRHRVPWTAENAAERIVVERAARAVETDEIASVVRAALVARGIGPDAEIELDPRTRRLWAIGARAGAIAVREVAHDPRTARFTATLAVPAGDGETDDVTVAGRVIHLIELAVPGRDIAAGEIVQNGDLVALRLRRELVQRQMLVNTHEMAGKAARRPLRQGQPVRAGDLRDPIAVAKGALVNIVYQTPRLFLTVKGKAGQEGAVGDTIQVVNTHSGRTVEGIIAGPDLVQVPNAAVLRN